MIFYVRLTLFTDKLLYWAAKPIEQIIDTSNNSAPTGATARQVLVDVQLGFPCSFIFFIGNGYYQNFPWSCHSNISNS